jgi:hypothetical protein
MYARQTKETRIKVKSWAAFMTLSISKAFYSKLRYQNNDNLIGTIRGKALRPTVMVTHSPVSTVKTSKERIKFDTPCSPMTTLARFATAQKSGFHWLTVVAYPLRWKGVCLRRLHEMSRSSDEENKDTVGGRGDVLTFKPHNSA